MWVELNQQQLGPLLLDLDLWVLNIQPAIQSYPTGKDICSYPYLKYIPGISEKVSFSYRKHPQNPLPAIPAILFS